MGTCRVPQHTYTQMRTPDRPSHIVHMQPPTPPLSPAASKPSQTERGSPGHFTRRTTAAQERLTGGVGVRVIGAGG